MQNLLFFNTDYLGMLKHGVQAKLDYKGFQLPSPAAHEAYAAASEMKDWLATNNDLANPLAQELVAQLSNCKREKMWGQFHERNSTKFVSLWRNLMQTAIGRMATPIFFQFVTDVMFKQLIKCHFLLKVDKIQAEKHQALTYEESNALRYAAGYVPQALRKQLEKGSHPLKEELILCLAEMCEGNDDPDVDHDSSSDWIKEINRGGLIKQQVISLQWRWWFDTTLQQQLHPPSQLDSKTR